MLQLNFIRQDTFHYYEEEEAAREDVRHHAGGGDRRIVAESLLSLLTSSILEIFSEDPDNLPASTTTQTDGQF